MTCAYALPIVYIGTRQKRLVFMSLILLTLIILSWIYVVGRFRKTILLTVEQYNDWTEHVMVDIQISKTLLRNVLN